MGNYSHVLLFEQFLISLKVTQLTNTPAGFSIKLPVSTFGASWGTVQTGLHDYLLWARLEKRGSAKPRAPLVQGSHTLQRLLWTSKVQTSKSCKEQNLGGKKKKSFQRWQNTDQKRALRGSNTTCSTVLLCSREEQRLLLLLVQSPRLFISDHFNFASPEELELFEINLVALLGCL